MGVGVPILFLALPFRNFFFAVENKEDIADILKTVDLNLWRFKVSGKLKCLRGVDRNLQWSVGQTLSSAFGVRIVWERTFV